MKSIDGTWDWGTDIPLKPFTDAWDVTKFIYNHHIPLRVFREISSDPKAWVDAERKQPTHTEFTQWGETRFASRFFTTAGRGHYLSLSATVISKWQLSNSVVYEAW